MPKNVNTDETNVFLAQIPFRKIPSGRFINLNWSLVLDRILNPLHVEATFFELMEMWNTNSVLLMPGPLDPSFWYLL